MDPLGGASPAMEILRRQMAENLARLRGSGLATARQAPSNPAGAPAASLRQTIARRIGSLDRSDPQFEKRAAALLVESILVETFGEALINDPGFRLMLREVTDAMTAEPDVVRELAALFAELKDSPG
jgi:hypothetical protein